MSTDLASGRSTFPSGPPPGLGLCVPAGDRGDEVLGQAIRVNPTWWLERLGEYGLEDEAPFPELETVARAHIFALADDACVSTTGARRLLWATLSWGTGRRQRGNRRRIRSVLATDGAGDLLLRAARASRDSAAAGLSVLQPRRRPLLTGLGPSFSTKFLHFAGAGNPDHPCLILDAVVAARLRSRPWPDFAPRYRWDPKTYDRYCVALHREAGRLTTADRRVVADHLEVELFTGAQPRR